MAATDGGRGPIKGEGGLRDATTGRFFCLSNGLRQLRGRPETAPLKIPLSSR